MSHSRQGVESCHDHVTDLRGRLVKWIVQWSGKEITVTWITTEAGEMNGRGQDPGTLCGKSKTVHIRRHLGGKWKKLRPKEF